MKTKTNGNAKRVELGEHIVADPLICHGKPTFRGTRIMVWQILDELAHGMSPAEIVKAWGGKITRAAIATNCPLPHESAPGDRQTTIADSGMARRSLIPT